MAGSAWTNQVQNQVIVAGVGGGVFVYDPTPGLGNLIASLTDAATDPFGNATVTGVGGYSKHAGVFYAVQTGGSAGANTTSYYTAAAAAGPYTLRGFVRADASGMRVISSSGLIIGAGGGVGGLLTGDLASGLSGGIPVTLIDTSTPTVGNTGTAGDITATWSVPAHDGDNVAKYVIETHLTFTTGATSAQAITIGADINNAISGGGTLVPLATLGAAFNGSALSTTYDVPIRLTLVSTAGGATSTPQITLSGPLGDTSSNRLSVNSANMAGHSNTAAWNPANLNTLAVYVQWAAAGGVGQLAGTLWSEFIRSGQQ
jgi:hypothetical protein